LVQNIGVKMFIIKRIGTKDWVCLGSPPDRLDLEHAWTRPAPAPTTPDMAWDIAAPIAQIGVLL
jgi:hypothetical protein